MYPLEEGADIGLTVISNRIIKLENLKAVYCLLDENDTYITIKYVEEQ